MCTHLGKIVSCPACPASYRTFYWSCPNRGPILTGPYLFGRASNHEHRATLSTTPRPLCHRFAQRETRPGSHPAIRRRIHGQVRRNDVSDVVHDYPKAFEAVIKCAKTSTGRHRSKYGLCLDRMAQSLGLRYYGIPGIGIPHTTGFNYIEPSEDRAFMGAASTTRLSPTRPDSSSTHGCRAFQP